MSSDFKNDLNEIYNEHLDFINYRDDTISVDNKQSLFDYKNSFIGKNL